MNHQQRTSEKLYYRPGRPFLKTLGTWLSLILGLWLFCPQDRSHAQPPQSPAEQRVLYQAQQAMAAKNYSEAQQMLVQFISERGEKVHYLVPFTLADALALDGQNADALTYYQKATEQYAADADLWLNMGKVCYDLQQFGKAAQYMHKAYELMTEKRPELLYQVAICFIQDNKRQQALGCLEQICTADAGEAKSDWFEALVDVYLKLGQHRKAVATLQQLLGRQGDRPRWWKLLAHTYLKDHDYNKAAAALKVYLDLKEATREEVIQLGDLYRLAGVPLKAARQYEKALQWSAASGDYEKIAAAYLYAHRPDKAVQALNQAIAHKPSARLWHMLGSVQYNRGQYRQAHEAFRQSLEIAQGDGSAALLMGYCALKLNKLNEAIEAFESAARFSQQRLAAQKALIQIKRLAQWNAKQ
jgi:tetratricopeptide (TPR) repeat protein